MQRLSLIFILLTGFMWLSCAKSSNYPTLKIAATAVPHAEILEFIAPELEKEGVHLDIIVMDDFNLPNRALHDREIDANFFQHQPFLDHQNNQFGYLIEPLVQIHLEPMGGYSQKWKNLQELPVNSIVAIPSDPTNLARALLLLEQEGFLRLNQHDPHTSLMNIIDNPRRLRILEIDSPLIVRSLPDVDLAIVSTNFALQGGLNPLKDALAIENKNSPFANIIAINKGDKNPLLEKLKIALTSPKVKEFIEKKYQGAIIPAF